MSHIESNRVKPVIEAGGDYFPPASALDFISSGCTLLDCVLGGGWPVGRIVNIVGDKSTGKTLLAIEALANFKRVFPSGRAVYNETEAAFDAEYAKQLGIDLGGVVMVEDCFTIEDLFCDIESRVNKVDDENPTLYVIDSLDALSDASEMESAFDAASFGAKKAQRVSKFFRQINKAMSQKRFLLMIISQTRANIGVTFGKKHTRSGGRALDFYASQVVWLAHRKRIEKQARGIKRVVGVEVTAKAEKNKIAMPFRSCDFPIIFGYGVDDITASADFLKSVKSFDGVLQENEKSVFEKWSPSGDVDADKVEGLRACLAKAVEVEWARIESNLRPKRGKYV